METSIMHRSAQEARSRPRPDDTPMPTPGTVSAAAPVSEGSGSGPPAPPIMLQRNFWNGWNASTRERELPPVSLRQRDVVGRWLSNLGRDSLQIIDIGCGAGWMCSHLAPFGWVTGTDLADEVLARARQRVPTARFIAGDFMRL